MQESNGILTATPSFSELWNNTYTSEVRILGGERMVAGIDNYRASYRTPEVPIPAAAWLFGSGLLGITGIARRHKLAA